MRKLIFLLATVLLTVGLCMAVYAADPATAPTGKDVVLSNGDANFDIMSEGVNGKPDGQAIKAEAFRNKNQLLIDFTKFEDYVKNAKFTYDGGEVLYYANADEIRNPGKPVSPDKTELKGDPNDESTYNEEGTLEPLYEVTFQDMRYQNWIVELNSSADKVESRIGSFCKKVKRANVEETVLGVKVYFPDNNSNAWARVRPPFPIKAYALPQAKAESTGDQYLAEIEKIQNVPMRVYNPRFKDVEGATPPTGSAPEDHAGYGILDNVGQIKQMTIEAYGLNLNIGVAVLINDQFEETTEYFIGYLNFPGWRRLIWNNPNYIANVDHRNIFKVPLYPVERPFIRFDSIKLYRQASEKINNFVTYFRNIKLSYDFAVPPEAASDIDDESAWLILKKKYVKRALREKEVARETIYLRKQERAILGANEKPKDFVNPSSKW